MFPLSFTAPVVDLYAVVVHNKIKLFWVAPAESVDHYGLRYRSILRDNSTEWGVVSPWVQTSWTLHTPFPGERYEFEVYWVKGGIQSSAQNTTYLYSKLSAYIRECSGSVVECLTRDRGATGLSLTGVTALCP